MRLYAKKHTLENKKKLLTNIFSAIIDDAYPF